MRLTKKTNDEIDLMVTTSLDTLPDYGRAKFHQTKAPFCFEKKGAFRISQLVGLLGFHRGTDDV